MKTNYYTIHRNKKARFIRKYTRKRVIAKIEGFEVSFQYVMGYEFYNISRHERFLITGKYQRQKYLRK